MKKIVMFRMENCEPCKQLYPVLKSLAKEYNILFQDVNTDTKKGADHAEKYSINSFPTVFIVEDDIIKDIVLGYSANLGVDKNRERFLEKILKQ